MNYNQYYYIKNKKKLIADAKNYRRKNKKKISSARRKNYLRKTNIILRRNKKYREKNQFKLLIQKRLYRLRKMGLPQNELEKAKRAIESHVGGCSVCHRSQPGGMGGWVADHDHKRKKFRGVLCNSCNAALGFVGDEIQTLLALIDYLVRWEESQ